MIITSHRFHENDLSFPEMKEISPLKKLISSQSIRIENLDVYIENQHILKDVNLVIPEKRITCIIGPSGCGKSTFLKTLNRMHDETPDFNFRCFIMHTVQSFEEG